MFTALATAASLTGCYQLNTTSGTGGGATGEDPSYGTTANGSTGSSFGSTGGGVYPPTPAPVLPPPDDTPMACAELDPAKPATLYLSADDSNSMASPALARELLEMGTRPWSIRTYEFLNYYHVEYPAAEANDVNIYLDGAPGSTAGETKLQIGVRSADPGARRPMTLTLVLDTSGSMGGVGIERERAAVRALTAELAEGDVVNVLTWSDSSDVLLENHIASGPNDPEVAKVVDALDVDGGTDLHAGLVHGYDLASASFDPTRLNRLVLISDGGANIGVTDADLIGKNSALGDDEGIYLIGVGAGPGEGYSDELMDTVTDLGRGAYVYLDRPEEAAHVFGDRFDETTEVAARGVQVRLDLPWYMQMQRFYGEAYSSDASKVKPQHLAPGDAMVFSQIVRACDPSVVKADDPVGVTITWQTPITHEARSKTVMTTVGALANGDAKRLAKGDAIVGYAEALKTFTSADLLDARAKVEQALTFGPDPELDEIHALLDKALFIATH